MVTVFVSHRTSNPLGDLDLIRATVAVFILIPLLDSLSTLHCVLVVLVLMPHHTHLDNHL